jgi:mono/diheme cytochrome c family protein
MRLKLMLWIIVATSSALALIASLNGFKLKGIGTGQEPRATTEKTNPTLQNDSERTQTAVTSKVQTPPEAKINALTPEQRARFEAGKELYIVTCGACHQPAGLGQEGLAPPLAGSEWVTGSEQRLIRIALHGARGPMTVKGKVYELDMPPMGILQDDQIAALLTYVRREWGHAASPVDPALITKIRAETEKREEAWTERELSQLH